MAGDGDMEDFGADALRAAADDGSLEAFAHDAALALEGDDWSAFVQMALAEHRAGRIDLLASAIGGEGPIDYMSERLYADTFPALDANVIEMSGLATALAARSRDGELPYFAYDMLSNWAAKDPARVRDSIASIRSGDAPAKLMIAMLQAGLKADRAEYLPLVATMLAEGPPEEAKEAGFVIGTVEIKDADERRIVEEALATAMRTRGSERQLAAFSAVLSIGTRDGADETFALTAIDAVEPDNSPAIRQAAARALFLARSRPSETLTTRICDLLAATQAGETDTIKLVDNAIAQHLAGPGSAPRLALLNKFLRSGVADLKAMDGVAHYVLRSNDGLTERLITEWVADGSDGLVAAVDRLISIPLSERPLTFDLDFTTHGLTVEQTLSSARKVVAGLILHPETAASIILSLMRTGHPDAGDGLEHVLFDPLLLSYWEGPREYLEEVAPEQAAPLKGRLERVIGELDKYTAAVRETGVIRELGPTERQRFLQQLLRMEEQRKMQKSVRKGSILADLFPTSVVLYGDSVVSEVYRGDDPPERQEFKMGTISHSMPLARLDAIDPIGFWYERIVLGMGKKP